VRWALIVLIVAGSAARADNEETTVATRQAEARRITTACGLPTDTILVRSDGSMHIRPKPTESYERVDCALSELRKSKLVGRLPTGFVGNERYGENMQ